MQHSMIVPTLGIERRLLQPAGAPLAKQVKRFEVAYLAHCRRDWREARTSDPRRAHAALSYIGRLYEVEEAYREANVTGDALRARRRQRRSWTTWNDGSSDSASAYCPRAPSARR